MPSRRIALLVALPLGAVLALTTVLVERISVECGLLPSQEAAMFLVLLAAFAVCARVAGDRAGTSAAPLRGVAAAVALLAVWLFAVDVIAVKFMSGAAATGGGLAVLLAAAVLLPAATATGWALPHLVRSVVTSTPTAAGSTGVLLALLSAGAALVLFFLPSIAVDLGIAATVRLAAFGGLGIALALLIAERPLPHGDAPPPETRLGVEGDAGAPGPAMVALGVVLGGCAVAWVALLAPLSGGVAPARGAVTALVLLGLALGSGAGGWLAGRMPRPDVRVILGVALTAVIALLATPSFGELSASMTRAAAVDGSTWGALIRETAPPIAGLGLAAGFALVCAVRTRTDWTGGAAKASGRLISFTAAGGVAGAALARLVLLPRAEPGYTILAVAGVALITCAILRFRAPGPHRPLYALLMISPLAVLMWPTITTSWLASAPSLDDTIAMSRPALPGARLEDGDDVALFAEVVGGAQTGYDALGQRLPALESAAGPVVFVAGVDGYTAIQIQGREMARLRSGADPDAEPVSVATGLVPALLTATPARALVLGAGNGLAAEALLGARIANVDVVVQDAALVRAAKAYRGVERGFADDPRTTIHPQRLRAFLNASGSASYDIVAVNAPLDPSVLSVEGLERVATRLKDDGVASIHVPLRELDDIAVRRVFATARAVFPVVWVFRFRADLVLVGAKQQPELRRARFNALLRPPTTAALLAKRAGLGGAGEVLGHLALDTTGVDNLIRVGDAGLMDDVPWLARRLEANRRAPQPARALADILNAGFPPKFETLIPDRAKRDRWIADAVAAWLAQDTLVATVWDQRIPYGTTPRGWTVRARVALASDQPAQAVRFLGLAMRGPEKPGSRRIALHLEALGRAAATGGFDRGKALGAIRRAVTDHPNDGRVLAAAAAARRQIGDQAGAKRAFEAALAAKKPAAPHGTGLRLARLLLADGPLEDEAEREARAKRIREVMEADPALHEDADALDLYLGVLPPRRHGEVAADLELVIDGLRRDDAMKLIAIARRHMALGDFGGAADPIARATELMGDRAPTWELRGLLDLARAAQEKNDAAQAVLQSAGLSALQKSVETSLDPDRARARAARIAQWFGRTLEGAE